MKQFSFVYDDDFRIKVQEARTELKKFPFCYIQILASYDNEEKMLWLCNKICEEFPDIPVVGWTTAGSILGMVNFDSPVINIFAFENNDSCMEYEVVNIRSEAEIGLCFSGMVRKINSSPEIKAVGFILDYPDFSTSRFCEKLSTEIVDPDLVLYGGICCTPDLGSRKGFIFSDKSRLVKNSILIMYFKGKDLNVSSHRINGWKPMGRPFRITFAEGSVIRQLDYEPGFKIYEKYLHISNNNDFMVNSLEFPLYYDHNGIGITRAISGIEKDGSLVMLADFKEGENVRLSYGDPVTILREIADKASFVVEEKPDIVQIVSCAARKSFWDDSGPVFELSCFKGFGNDISGFFSHGEFVREKGFLNQHNITLITVVFRENKGVKRKLILDNSYPKLSLASRMGAFISEVSYEMESLNAKLELAVNQLNNMATTDILTGLGNRYSFEEYISRIFDKESDKNWCMIMFDVNGLKYVNDTFGHSAGDDFIRKSAKIISEVYGNDGRCFRIGGDEFVCLLVADESLLVRLRTRFYSLIKEYNKNNSSIISIAMGESFLHHGLGMFTESDWKLDADLKMYRDKSETYRKFSDGGRHDNVVNNFIRCIISIEEAKDSYTAYHSERVKALTSVIVSLLGITYSEAQLIVDAAYLHDIGKVGISDGVLLKKGRLTDEEFNVIKQHSAIGGRILMNSNYTLDFVDIVVHHHERYDGKGYPDGLKADKIPLGARIVAIADSIDAMTSKRVYRNALSPDYCRKEIEDNLGKMYDPYIGKVVLDNWDKIVDCLMRNPRDYLPKF